MYGTHQIEIIFKIKLLYIITKICQIIKQNEKFTSFSYFVTVVTNILQWSISKSAGIQKKPFFIPDLLLYLPYNNV